MEFGPSHPKTMGAENTSSFPFLFIPLTPDMTLFS